MERMGACSLSVWSARTNSLAWIFAAFICPALAIFLMSATCGDTHACTHSRGAKEGKNV